MGGGHGAKGAFAHPTTNHKHGVVPANAGTHTPGSIVFTVASRSSSSRDPGGYGSLRSQGRREMGACL